MTTANFDQMGRRRGRDTGPAFKIGRFTARFHRTSSDPTGPQWQISRRVDGTYELVGP
jgi:hypothetical protein